MENKEFRIAYKAYKNNELTNKDQALIQKAIDIAEHSYSPYSKFRVGAAVELSNGVIIEGSNQENAAYPSGLCAERVALFYANSQFPEESVVTLAVVALNKNGILPNPVPPCGGCRQVLLETETRYKKPMRILLKGQESVYEFFSAADLLPFNFDKKYLDIEE